MLFVNRRIRKRNEKIKDLVSSTGQHAFHLALQYTNDKDTAKDIVQQSLMKITEAFRVPDEGINFWFLKIVRNTALDHIRHESTKKRLAREIKTHDEQTRSLNGNDFEKNEIVNQTQTLIHTCLKKLSTEHREIIVLKDLQDYSYEQIAKILDIAKGTVMSRLHRARLALKNEVINYDTK